MNSIVRLVTAVNRVNCANPHDCMEEIRRVLEQIPDAGFDLAVFPRLSLCSPSCGNLFSNSGFLEECSDALENLAASTAGYSGYIVVGVALEDWGRSVSAMAVLYQGELVALIPTVDNPSPFAGSGHSGNYLPTDTVFACGGLRFCVLACSPASLPLRAAQALQTGCDLLIVPAYAPVRVGYIDEICQTAQVISRSAGCAVAVVNGGVGDTSSPYLYQGFCAVYECGREMVREAAGSAESFACAVDLDADIIRAAKRVRTFRPPQHTIQTLHPKPTLMRSVDPLPFLPREKREARLTELFVYQVHSLAARMKNIGVEKLVVGVSGGLDSTAALLVCSAAMEGGGLPRENVLGVTMPGPGTSRRTRDNALALMERLGVSHREVPIGPAVERHFADIGHSGEPDATYENAQARERAQILLDIANMTGAIVVGTGDLSELALGFCTFAGDHIANYSVNSCIPKTLLRDLVSYMASTRRFSNVRELLEDILDTPVSPELLPPGEDGEITQITEEILGPYALHDFFLYYFLKHRFRPSKIYFYACVAFAGSLEPSYIKDKLRNFFTRFCAGQFKRSCAPDCANITEVNLSPASHYIPSDLDPSGLLREFEKIDFIIGKEE